MCIIAVAHRVSAHYPLIAAANRDESHARPTLDAHWWGDSPGVLGGRDEAAGGTWLAVDRTGRFAAVTNLREEGGTAVAPRSRGLLVSDYLAGHAPAEQYLDSLASGAGAAFGPFNLLLFDGKALHYGSNRAAPRTLEPGVHALSNAGLDSEWPKVARARRGVAALLDDPDPAEALFALLAERSAKLHGVDDRQVSMFQLDPFWGTRCSTVLLVDRDGNARFRERSFDAAGLPAGEQHFEFRVAAPSAGAGAG